MGIVRTALFVIVGVPAIGAFIAGAALPDQFRISEPKFASRCTDPEIVKIADSLARPDVNGWEGGDRGVQSDDMGIRITLPVPGDPQTFRVYYREHPGQKNIVTTLAEARPHGDWVRVPDRTFSAPCRVRMGIALVRWTPSLDARDALAARSDLPRDWPHAPQVRR